MNLHSIPNNLVARYHVRSDEAWYPPDELRPPDGIQYRLTLTASEQPGWSYITVTSEPVDDLWGTRQPAEGFNT